MSCFVSSLLLCVCVLCCFFCFQAEDGIRDLVRSRGLGDVYKRQAHRAAAVRARGGLPVVRRGAALLFFREVGVPGLDNRPVSYTHLTLPTSDLV